MKHFDQLAMDLTGDLLRDMPMDLQPMQARQIAEWILRSYRPPVEWLEDPPDERASEPRERFTWRIRCRLTVAGRQLEYVGMETPEMRGRASQGAKDQYRAHIRYRVGKALMDYLEGEEA